MNKIKAFKKLYTIFLQSFLGQGYNERKPRRPDFCFGKATLQRYVVSSIDTNNFIFNI